RCASTIQIVRPLESIAETQPQLQPALLRLWAITSQFFIRFRAIALMIISLGLNCGFEFEKGRQLLICMHNKRPASLRSAATTQIGRPLPSVVAIEPQFHPALRRFSRMISQYFTRGILPVLLSTRQ